MRNAPGQRLVERELDRIRVWGVVYLGDFWHSSLLKEKGVRRGERARHVKVIAHLSGSPTFAVRPA
jgi:hypothetical protein